MSFIGCPLYRIMEDIDLHDGGNINSSFWLN